MKRILITIALFISACEMSAAEKKSAREMMDTYAQKAEAKVLQCAFYHNSIRCHLATKSGELEEIRCYSGSGECFIID